MKIATSSTGPSLDAQMDERFGRCPCFVITDGEGTIFDLLDNPHANLGSGAGIQAAGLLVRRRVDVVLTGRCGPNASETLAAGGIGVVTGCTGTVRQALKKFTTGLDGSFSAEDSPTSGDTASGVPIARGGAAPVPDGSAPGRERGMGRGLGRGMGRGMGGGAGRGRGREIGRGNRPENPTES